LEKKNSHLKETFIYIGTLCVFSLSLIFIFLSNDNYKKIKNPILLKKSTSNIEDISSSLHAFFLEISKNFHHPLNTLLVQIAAVLLASRLLSLVFRRIGQPAVIGEITAGLLLGPSFLGMFYPGVSQFLFPTHSLNNLQLLSQFGLIVFMFVVGLELDISVLKEKAKSAILISHVSILFPFMLGCTLALFYFDKYAPSNISFLSFGLFLGISMSITAFPVLARIIQEKGLSKSSAGIIAITCAAVDDISAWTILALILAIIHAENAYLIGYILTFGLLYIGLMVYIIQPVLEKMSKLYITKEIISRGVISVLTILMLFSAILSESLGVHALFGAFLAGVIMPTNTRLRGVITEKFEDFSAVLLLPLFFAFTGLRTKIQLLNSQELWIDCLIVVIVASIGKILGSMLPAKFTGSTWKESGIIGFLMNTRGLMELVVLNIGYDMGILSPEIFTMFVIMALATTFITSPMVGLFLRKETSTPKPSQKIITGSPKILIAFGPPSAGQSLLSIAYFIYQKSASYNALHLSPLTENISLSPTPEKESENFQPIHFFSKEKGIKVNTILRHSDQFSNEINKTIQLEQTDILFMGAAKTIFSDNAVGGKVDLVLNETECRSVIFIDRGFKELNSLLLFFHNLEESDYIFEVGGQIQKTTTTDITLLYEKENEPSEDKLRKFFQKGIKTIPTEKQLKKLNHRYSLVVVGYKHWLEMDPTLKDTILMDKIDQQKENPTSILILKEGTKNYTIL